MAEYVKKEDVLALAEWDAFYNEEEDDYEEFEFIYPMAVRLMPAADVVEVVRCKNCKHHRPGTGFTFIEDGKHQRYCSCEKWGRCVLDEDFCSYGERKETNND